MVYLVDIFVIVLYLPCIAVCQDCPASPPCKCRMNTRETLSQPINVIDCSGNNLKTFPTFKSWSGEPWDEVILSENNFTFIPDYAISKLGHVRALHLDRNQIYDVSDNALEGLKFPMETLSLRNNQLNISSLPWAFLDQLTQLNSLDMGENPGKMTNTLPPDAFGRLEGLETLGLQQCGIVSLNPTAFAGHGHIRWLRLAGNKLTNVPTQTLVEMKRLEHLDLGENVITSIPAKAFQNPTLQWLYLYGNDFQDPASIDREAFTGVGSTLRVLSLRSARMIAVPTHAIGQLANIADLDLSNNSIGSIPDGTFANMRLQKLDISSNPLKMANGMFTGIEDVLYHLVINDLDLVALPLPVLKPLTSLVILDASKNRFTSLNNQSFSGLAATNIKYPSIAPDTFTNTTLKDILFEINNNSVSNVSFINLQSIGNFNVIDLTNNPVNCTCDLWHAMNQPGHAHPPILGVCATPLRFAHADINRSFVEAARKECQKINVRVLDAQMRTV